MRANSFVLEMLLIQTLRERRQLPFAISLCGVFDHVMSFASGARGQRKWAAYQRPQDARQGKLPEEESLWTSTSCPCDAPQHPGRHVPHTPSFV